MDFDSIFILKIQDVLKISWRGISAAMQNLRKNNSIPEEMWLAEYFSCISCKLCTFLKCGESNGSHSQSRFLDSYKIHTTFTVSPGTIPTLDFVLILDWNVFLSVRKIKLFRMIMWIPCCPEITTHFLSAIYFQNRWMKHDVVMERCQMFLLWCLKTIQKPSGQYRPLPDDFQFFSLKKSFFSGILFASEFPYLRVVNFTLILGMLFIDNGKLIIEIVCTMRNVNKRIPLKKWFFEITKTKKNVKIGRGWSKWAGRLLNRFGTSQQKHLTPFHNKIMLHSSILVSGCFRTERYKWQHDRTEFFSKNVEFRKIPPVVFWKSKMVFFKTRRRISENPVGEIYIEVLKVLTN